MSGISVSATILALVALIIPLKATAEPLGQCAHQRNLEMKIASCIEASKATSYPWIAAQEQCPDALVDVSLR